MRIGIIAAASLFVITNPSRAQDCGQILQYGIWESRDSSGSVVDRQQFANWACSASARSSSGSVNIEIPDVGSFGGSKADSSSSSDCASNSGSYLLSKQFRDSSRSAAVALANAWQACMTAEGSHATVLYGDDLNTFTIFLRRNDPQSTEDTAKLVPVSTGQVNCTLTTAALRSGVGVQGSRSIVCKRKSAEHGVTIEVNFKKGGGKPSLVIPAVRQQERAPTVAERLARNERFRIVFDVAKDDACGIPWNRPGNLLGSIWGKGTYEFRPAANGYTMMGPNQSAAGCAQAPGNKDTGVNAANGTVMIWGRGFHFDNQGNVWDRHNDQFNPGRNRPVGRISFN
jgi:hypothetical protein